MIPVFSAQDLGARIILTRMVLETETGLQTMQRAIKQLKDARSSEIRASALMVTDLLLWKIKSSSV